MRSHQAPEVQLREHFQGGKGLFPNMDDYEVTYEPLPSAAKDAMPREIQEETSEIYNRVTTGKTDDLTRLTELSRKYPEFKSFQNWILIVDA